TAHAANLSASCPPHRARRLLQEHALEELDCLAETFGGGGEAVLVLDAEGAVVAGDSERADEIAPELLVLAVADAAERPRPLVVAGVVLRVEDAVEGDVRPIEIDVLRVDVEERVGAAERAHCLKRIDALPEEVARVEVRTQLRPGRGAQPQQGLGVVDEEARMRL